MTQGIDLVKKLTAAKQRMNVDRWLRPALYKELDADAAVGCGPGRLTWTISEREREKKREVRFLRSPVFEREKSGFCAEMPWVEYYCELNGWI